MHAKLSAILLAVLMAPPAEGEIIRLLDVPQAIRIRNYPDPYGSGSCVYASTRVLLSMHGFDEMEQYFYRYKGGENAAGIIQKVHEAGLRYAYTHDADREFIRWISRNRLGAIIWYYPSHCVNIVDWDENQRVIRLLDNNRINRYMVIEEDVFFPNWSSYGGFALTLVYPPPPPFPRYKTSYNVRRSQSLRREYR